MAAKGIISTGAFLLVLAFASVLVVVFSMIFDPFFAMMKLGTVRDLLIFMFPKGLLFVIFFVGVARYYYELQEKDEVNVTFRRGKNEF